MLYIFKMQEQRREYVELKRKQEADAQRMAEEKAAEE